MTNREALKAWRADAGLTQKQAADLLKASLRLDQFTQGMWSEWERDGGRVPKLRYAVAIEQITAGRVKVEGWVPPVAANDTAKKAG